MKLVITGIDNGWIVEITNQGFSCLKEPYGITTLYFKDLLEMVSYMKEHCPNGPGLSK